MFKPKELKSLGKYKIWVKFEDGTQGEVDWNRIKKAEPLRKIEPLK